MHDQAFHGLNILIFGEEAMMPMRIEQSIAVSAPALEVGLDSFEDYHQALSFVKSSKRCGLVFALTKDSGLPIADVFNNLLQPWSNATGLPGYAVLLSNGSKTTAGLELMARNRHVIDYIDVGDLLDQSKAGEQMLALWQKYIDCLERDILPDVHQDWLVCLAEDHGVMPPSLHFSQRLAQFFRTKANIGWAEAIALQWFMITDVLNEYQQRLGARAGGLFSLASHVDISNLSIGVKEDVRGIAQSSVSTAGKVKAIIQLLDGWRISGILAQRLDEIERNCRPFDPALLRTIAKNSHRILDFAADADRLAFEQKAV
jgi:hypothetical protein